METEGSGGSQIQLIHPTVDVDEAAALGVTKRARKRSRYLSPPYTDTGVQEEKAAGSHKQREDSEEEEEGPPHVSAAEVLSALRVTAFGQREGMYPAALRFLAMYSRSRNRNRNSVFVDDHPDSHAAAGGGGGGNKSPSVSAAGVMLDLNVGPDDGSLAKEKNPHPLTAAAAGGNADAKQQKENAAVLEHAIIATHGHGHASQSLCFSATATHGYPNPPPVATTVTSLVHNEKKKKRRNKKRLKTIGQHSYSYAGNPVALVLDFAEGTPLPSREDLFSTFSRFGVVIDSETNISQDKHNARVAFATRAQAESALRSAATLGGAFGPPLAVASLQDLTLNMPPPPLPKLPLPVIRNNLGKMILSLSSKATAAPQQANAETAIDSLSLLGEMQHLLAKVDKVLQVQRASATAHRA